MFFLELTAFVVAIVAAFVAGWLSYRKYGAKAEKLKDQLGA